MSLVRPRRVVCARVVGLSLLTHTKQAGGLPRLLPQDGGSLPKPLGECKPCLGLLRPINAKAVTLGQCLARAEVLFNQLGVAQKAVGY